MYNMKNEKSSFIFLVANMKIYIIPTYFEFDLLYSSHRHSSLSLGRPRMPLYVPTPFDDLPTADER